MSYQFARDAKTLAKIPQLASRYDAKGLENLALFCRIGETQFGGAAAVLEERASRSDSLLNVLAKRQLEEVLQYETADKPTLGLFRQFRGMLRMGDPSAKTWTQSIYDSSGDVAYTAQGGGDGVPLVNQAGVEVERPYHEIRNGFKWDIEELDAASRGDFSMLTEARSAATHFHEIEWNLVFFYGYGALQMDGIVNFPNAAQELSPDNGTASSRYFVEKTPDLAALDLMTIVDRIQQQSDNNYMCSDVALAPVVYDDANSRRMADGSDVTILDYVRSKRAGVEFHRVLELAASFRSGARASARINGSVGSTYGVGFDRRYVEMRAGMTPRVLAPVQMSPFDWMFGVRSRVGGIKCTKPDAMFRMTEMAA